MAATPPRDSTPAGPPRTKEEILAIAPGKALDLQVAQCVIGHAVVEDPILGTVERYTDADGSAVWSPLEPYSQDPKAAELVVDHMVAKGFENAIYWADFGDGRFTEPEAICKAALLTLAGEMGDFLQ